MPLYEFKCEKCGKVFERLQKIEENYPPCPHCESTEVIKLPSIFGFHDKSVKRAEREVSILKRARDYIVDGKLKDAHSFLEKAKEFCPTDKIKRLSDVISNRKSVKVGYVKEGEYVVTKKREK